MGYAKHAVVEREVEIRDIALLLADSRRGDDCDERLATVLCCANSFLFEIRKSGKDGSDASVAEVWVVDCGEGWCPLEDWGCADSRDDVVDKNSRVDRRDQYLGISRRVFDVAGVDCELRGDARLGYCVRVDEKVAEFVRGAGNFKPLDMKMSGCKRVLTSCAFVPCFKSRREDCGCCSAGCAEEGNGLVCGRHCSFVVVFEG
jgi:hypothetical protein